MIKINCTVKKLVKRETWKVRNCLCMLTPMLTLYVLLQHFESILDICFILSKIYSLCF